MIGLFDSGHGGLTIWRELESRFPARTFVYLGDHANAPYGNRPSDEIVALTQRAVGWLLDAGCRLVVLACNPATSVACRRLQREWLPRSGRRGVNVLGIVAPTVEAATQTPWAVTTPQYPQKYNSETIAVFGTARTIATGVYSEEIAKRCPKVRVVEQACPRLAGAIEAGVPEAELDALVAGYVADMRAALEGEMPDRAILGCTHFPLIEPLFRRHLPRGVRLLSQPAIVADSLEDYLARHPEYGPGPAAEPQGAVSPTARSILLTTGDTREVEASLKSFWPVPLAFQHIDLARPASAQLRLAAA